MAFDPSRFHDAQRGVIEGALAELRRGRKVGHWMWFVFPQVDVLGRSETSRFYAIRGLEEARAYLADPVLGTRLRDAARAMLDGGAATGRSATEILGEVDAVKLRSSMTLFARAAPDEPLFGEVLTRFYAGRPDTATEGLIG
jgi:uncharacterized protein (DUF1810 family)